MNMNFIGVDIGQATDYTAITIIEPTGGILDRQYLCKHIERVPLHTSYVGIVQIVKEIKQALEANYHAKTMIIIDATGCGRPVVEMAQRAIMGSVVGLTITGGLNSHGWHVAKKDLISALQVALFSGSLKIHSALKFAELLKKELVNYRVKITAGMNESFGPWRDAEHDDLVLSLALSVYACARFYPHKVAI